jgi:uncharacterized protein
VVIIAAGATQSPAISAGFDCRGKLAEWELTVCVNSDLSKLDSKLNEVYQSLAAKLQKGEASTLRLEQRAWLKTLAQTCQVDPITRSTLYPPSLEPPFIACLQSAYQLRIYNLSVLLSDEPSSVSVQTKPPLTARDLADQIGGQLPRFLNEGDGRILEHIATLNGLALVAGKPQLPRPASTELKEALNGGKYLYEFTSSDVPGAAVAMGGTASCSSWLAFDWHGNEAKQVDLPAVLQQGSCAGYGGSSGLASWSNKTFAFGTYDMGAKFTWIVQSWLGSGWSKPEARTATLSVQPSPQALKINCKRSECNELQDLALDLARLSNIFDPQASGFPAISDADKALIKSAVSAADSGSKFSTIYDDKQATVVDFEGQKLVARAGLGAIAGWREDGMIHIEMWLLQPPKLVPLAEFVFFPERKPITVDTIDDWHPDVH